MNKEKLIEKGLSEKQANVVLEIWKESMKGFVPRQRLDEVSNKLKEAKQAMQGLQKDLSHYQDGQKSLRADKKEAQKRQLKLEIELSI